MSLAPIDQTLQFTAWFLSLTELILSFYVLLLNAWHISNRYLSLLLLFISINSFATGAMSGAVSDSQAVLPTILLAATTSAIQPGLILSAFAIFKPGWLTRGKCLLQWILLSLFLLPTILTLIDVTFKTTLWYSGINSISYAGGFLKLSEFTNGILGNFLHFFSYGLFSLALIVFLIYIAVFDKGISTINRRLAWTLIILTIGSLILLGVIGQRILPGATILITSSFFAVFYTYTAFEQMISERRQQRGRLQTRLTSLILTVSIPVIFGVALFIIHSAGEVIAESAYSQLRNTAQTIKSTTLNWLSNNSENLKALTMMPGIPSMDSKIHLPLLKATIASHPTLSYVKTVDWMGNTVASSDNDEFQNVNDQQWFQEIKAGADKSYQILQSKTNRLPILVEAMPVKDEFNKSIGVAMFASEIPMMSKELVNSWEGKPISAYLIDSYNQVMAHSDSNYPAYFTDMGNDPAVLKLRSGVRGTIYSVDSQGKPWLGYVDQFNNGWGLIIQLPQADVLNPLLSFQKISWIALFVGTLLILLLTWLTVRQALRPVRGLIHAATSVSRGDLTAQAPIDTEDELGHLARVFNHTVVQLREMISNLETRVNNRTRELERRTVEMQVAADIARDAASIHDQKTLLNQATRLISERFGFYHVGIFLIDETKVYALLQAANSEGGQRMLARGHKLKVGQAGIVGHVASRGVPRIALDVGADATFFNNPDLPTTRSEIALPLMIRNQVIGVLDVQSTEAEAFSQRDASILQILADQIALAIENTHLIEESQKALREIEILYLKASKEAWKQQTEGKKLAFRYNRMGVDGSPVLNNGNHHSGGELSNQGDERNFFVPIKLRGLELGFIHLSRGSDEEPWSPQERKFIEEAVSQVAEGLENARLVQEIKKHAQQEEMLSQLSTIFSRTLGFDALLKSAVNELSYLPGVAEVAIHMGVPDHSIEEKIRESTTAPDQENS